MLLNILLMILIALKQLTKHYSAADNYVMSLEAVCVQRLFADGKLTVAEQQKSCDKVAQLCCI